MTAHCNSSSLNDHVIGMEMGVVEMPRREEGTHNNPGAETGLLTNARTNDNHRQSKSDKKRRQKCRRPSVTAIIQCITTLGVVVLFINEFFKKEMIHASINLPQAEAIRQPPISGLASAEEYTIDANVLFNRKELRWVPMSGNNGTFSKPSTNKDCITITVSGTYKVLNSMTFNYKDVDNIYHAIALVRGNDKGIKRKASYRWDTLQTGRLPITLQFVSVLESGDDLCIQSNRMEMIYASTLDNSFLLERIQ